jgi:peptidoglycan/LPS O-acetylase OafA/YrhL
MSRIHDSISSDIDVIRGLAALGVIWGHTMWSIRPGLTSTGGPSIVLDGAFWVWVFFVISGYLQGHAFFGGRYGLDAAGVRAFWRARVFRIVPLFWFALAVAYTLQRFLAVPPVGPGEVLRQLTATTSNYSLVGPLWSIAVELQFYILVVFVCLTAERRWGMLPIWALLAGSLAVLFFFGSLGDNPIQPRALPGNLWLFLSGVLMARWQSNARAIPRNLKVGLVTSLVLGAFFFQHVGRQVFWFRHGGMFVAMVLSGVILMSFQEQQVRLTPQLRALKFVGVHCYGVYVYAALLGQTMYLVGGPSAGVLGLAIELLSVPLAVLSYRYLEEPFLRLKGRPTLARPLAGSGLPVVPPAS